MKYPKAVVFEMLGYADPELVKMVAKLAAEHPQWEASPAKISGGNTEMADAVRYKVPTISVIGLTKEGYAPYWHQKADTFDKLDPCVMEQTWELTTALIERIDSSSNQ